MTREDAIQALKDLRDIRLQGVEWTEALDMAIEALSAEAVQGVGRYEKAMQKLREMPRCLNGVKVKQINKIQSEAVQGDWIYDPNGYDYGLPAWKCDKCGCINANIPPTIMTKESKPNYAPVNPHNFSGSNFCPNCGAKMHKGGDDE